MSGTSSPAWPRPRDPGRVQPGQKLLILRLILGPSGGVGTFAVQLARAFCAKAAGLRRRQDGPGRVHRRRPRHRLSPSGHCRGGWVLRPGPRHRRQSPGFRFAARSGYGQIGSAGATAITMPRIGGSGRARGAAHSPPDQRILGDQDRSGLVLLLAQCDWRSISATRALPPLCAVNVDLAMLPAVIPDGWAAALAPFLGHGGCDQVRNGPHRD